MKDLSDSGVPDPAATFGFRLGLVAQIVASTPCLLLAAGTATLPGARADVLFWGALATSAPILVLALTQALAAALMRCARRGVLERFAEKGLNLAPVRAAREAGRRFRLHVGTLAAPASALLLATVAHLKFGPAPAVAPLASAILALGSVTFFVRETRLLKELPDGVAEEKT